MPHKIFVTEDGSHSLLSEHYNVSYHSKYGAIGESQHVFIEAGLHYMQELKKTGTIRIFEMGFGTGLNAYMSMLVARKKNTSIDYYTIEKYPLDLKTVLKLNYTHRLKASLEDQERFTQLHEIDSKVCITPLPNLSFTKIIGDVTEEQLPDKVDVIYYDAFSPRSQPELWDTDQLTKLYKSLNAGGILVTYCAQGAFKRALRAVGFHVEGIPGPHGKREMTRAHKA